MANFTPQEIEQFLQEFFDVVGARQYVGARYVPIFGRAGEDTIEWDDGAPYEPLTVVMHGGVSYVSRRYVPNGIQITNTAYWVETYRFNAQVEQYRQEVLALAREHDEIKAMLPSTYFSADDTVKNYVDEQDAGVTAALTDTLVPYPVGELPKYGQNGQVLSTNGTGATEWVDPITPSDAQAEAIITDWLDAHPEATTTVEDHSVTAQKLNVQIAYTVVGTDLRISIV